MQQTNRLIEKAVDIWCNALKKPNFDNGDKTVTGEMINVLASKLVEKELVNDEELDNKIAIFRQHLTANLIKRSKIEGESFWESLSCDYNPCTILNSAAHAANIPARLFSVKSSVDIESGFLEVKFGYGCLPTLYYPLPDGRWLKAKLRGPDMEKVISSVMDGNPLGFEIE
ncbi:hypothetical protein [Pseudoalteromonas rhizosphaerae]|uniref:hypothetical protein n=1 Tax=Pseudoalteromonas rhizosphaerae TaxID=2518973 RepID=UPI00384BE594